MNPVSGTALPEVSAVIPVYQSSETLAALAARLARVFEAEGLRYEIIFVDDASSDGSFDVLRDLAERDPAIVVLGLEKNVGQHRAVLAGLAHARGEEIAVLDADLQDPPEALPALLRGLRGGHAAVFGGRRGLYESRARLFTSRLFKALLSRISGAPADAGMFLVMTREMAASLLCRDERYPFLVSMIGSSGLPVSSMPVARAGRAQGRSSYTSWMRLRTGVRAIVSALSWRWRARRPIRPTSRETSIVKVRIGARFDEKRSPEEFAC